MVGQLQHLGGTFRVSHEQGIRMIGTGLFNIRHLEPVVGRAVALPADTFLLRQVAGDVTAEVAIWHHQQLAGLKRTGHIDGVGGGAADIAFGLDGRRRIDIGDHGGIRVLPLQITQRFGGDHVRHRAARINARQQHGLLRGEDRGALSHEMHPAENDHLLVGFFRLHRQGQGVSGDIGYFLNFVALVVVSEEQGILLGTESTNFSFYFLLSHNVPSLLLNLKP